MKRDEGLAAALFALVMGGAVAIAIVNDITAPLCAAAKIKSAAPDKIEFGCFEFWLNRYQTLLAGCIGAGIALYVVRPVFRQLREMTRQSEVAVRSTYIERVRNIELEAERYIAIARLVLKIERELTRRDIEKSVAAREVDAIVAQLTELEALANAAAVSTHVTERATAQAPADLYTWLFKFISKARGMVSGPRTRMRERWGSCFPVIDDQPINLKDNFYNLAMALQPDIRRARADLYEVERRMI